MLRPEDVLPDVEPFSLYIDAFNELSTCRNSSMGMSPIPFTAIVEYTKIYEVGDFYEFLEIIRVMDSELLKLESKKSKNGQGNLDKNNKGSGRR